MLKRWCARLLRRAGLDVPFTDVICPEHVKTIAIDADWNAEVIVERSLVFLDEPERGDLWDTVPAGQSIGLEHFAYDSADGKEIARAQKRGAIVSYWEPRQPITRYGLYRHMVRWRPSGSCREAALHAEAGCDVRTGVLAIRICTPATFETAVAFRRPRWRRLNTERRLVKYALARLESDAPQPALEDNRRRVVWTIATPRIGDRYVCVAFHPHGVAQWQERLKETSVVNRVRQWIRPLVLPSR